MPQTSLPDFIDFFLHFIEKEAANDTLCGYLSLKSHRMKNILFILALTAFALSTHAQSFSVSGTIVGENENLPLINALVVLKTDSTTVVNSVVSDHQGVFRLEGIARGNYLLEVSYLGYQSLTTSLEIVNQNISLGSLFLKEESEILDEVIVKDKLPLAVQRGDTTAFNADAFKVNPDASAEDLVRKMPGMAMENGKMKAQGEEVREVLVDGKPFFGNDPSAALRNLPAEVVDKIEVFDRRSDQSQFTGFDDGETTKTINIVTRSNMKNGQFGKIYGGGGLDNDGDGQYNAGGMINYFNGDTRLSVIGQTNNINIQNFASEDLVGVMGSSGGRGGGRGGRGGGWGRGGNDFQVSSQGGITTTHALGLNYSDMWGKKMEVSGSYFFNKSDNNNDRLLNREYVNISDGSQFYNEDNQKSSTNLNHRLNFNMEYQIDSSNSIVFRPRISFQQNDGFSNMLAQTTENNNLVNQTSNQYRSDLQALNFSGSLLYRHKFVKPRRTFSINLNSSYNDKAGESFLLSGNDYIIKSDTLDQFSDLMIEGWSLSSNVDYTEPVGKNGMLMANYRISVEEEDSNKETFDFLEASQKYDSFNSGLSNVFTSEKTTNQGGLAYNVRKGKEMFMVRLTAQATTLKNEQTFPTGLQTQRNFFNILPMVMYSYRPSKTDNLRIFYRSRTNLPAIEQLQNVIDNSNPLQLSAGNPDLKQAVQHSLNFRFSKSNTEKASVFFLLLGGEYGDDYITKATYLPNSNHPIYDDLGIEKGAQLETPVNLDGYWNARSFLTYGFPVKKLKSNLNLNVSANYSRIPGQINDDINFSNNITSGLGLTLSSNISEKVDFTIGSNSNYIIVRNSLQTTLNSQYLNQSSQLKFNWIIGKGIVFQTDFQHQLYTGLLDEADQHFVLWNLGVGKKLFKNQRGDLRLTVFDILNQNRSIQRNVTDVYIEDVETQVLQRFVMLTFTYQLRNFVKKEPTQKPEEDERRGWR